MRFNASPEDFLKGELVTPGFHPAVVLDASEEMSKGGLDPKTGKVKEKSQYLKVTFKIVAGEFKGVTIIANFSEKAATFARPFYEAISGTTVDKKKGMNIDLSPATIKGKPIDIMVVRGEYENKPKNEIEGYRKYSGPSVTEAPAQAGV